jgi:pimeloyl-ACP methyl ester carboxylesterase
MIRAEPVRSVTDGAGEIHIATASGGIGEPDALFVHATGFCKEVWSPVIDAMVTDPFPWLSMDLRGHGDSDVGEFPHRWSLLGGDVLSVVNGRTEMVGVGHSGGGTALVRAEAAHPGTFRHLVVIEPIIFPALGRRIDGPMSVVAMKRRTVFPSREEARERFSTGPFSDWTAESLDAYLDGAFVQSEIGFELKCKPEVEADYYAEGTNHDTWDIAGSFDTPVTVVAGERSTTHQEPYLSSLVSRFQRADLIVLGGVGHLVPMEDPKRIASIVDAVTSRETVDAPTSCT